jgi:hypothetical protein
MSERERYNPPETGEQIISHLFDTSHPVPPEYERLILAQEHRPISPHETANVDYSREWPRILRGENEQNLMKAKLVGGTLIDLGGGIASHMRALVKQFEASEYINVDHNPAQPSDPLRPTTDEQDEALRVLQVNSDMLKFLARMRDASAQFTINGIDEFIIGDSEYHQALARELVRATKQGGLIFGVNSMVYHHLKPFIEGKSAQLKKVNWKWAELDETRLDLMGNPFIFEKI